MINRQNIYYYCCIMIATLFLSSCASSKRFKEIQYPPTTKVEPIFQISQAPKSCRVFANLFATIPANMTIGDFEERISAEAKSRGADLMLIGESRQCTTESSLNFSYYGPDREYTVNEWSGWSFGLEVWGDQGSWATIGYDEWMQSNVHFDFPVVMQVVFLRCQQ